MLKLPPANYLALTDTALNNVRADFQRKFSALNVLNCLVYSNKSSILNKPI
jgi:hypothetical protein